jgi:hypothetical protein
VFEAVAQGRVHLSGIVLLAPHLGPENASELLAAATHQSKAAIERLLAERFPKLDVPGQLAPIRPQVVANTESEHAPGHVDVTAPPEDRRPAGHVDTPARLNSIAPERFAVQFTLDQAGHDLLRQAQELLGPQVGRGDIAEVFHRALEHYVRHLERRKFAATARPGPARRTLAGSRHIPAHVKREVWRRDGGRCTYVSDSGRRCEARRGLEFDHVKEFARGGEATVDGIRLRCRGHNQFTAERTFGAGFMQQKREMAAKVRAAKVRAAKAAKAVEARQRDPDDEDVYRALRTLGYRDGDSRRALESCANMHAASPEQKLRQALKYFPLRCHPATTPKAAQGVT